MIEKTLSGITHTSYLTSTDIPFCVNDTFDTNTNISFVCTSSAILDIFTKTINIGNITNYTLYYRLTDLESNIILSDDLDLTTNNFLNNSIIVYLSSLNTTFTHEYVMEDMDESEIYLLYKSYKLIFRIYEKGGAEETTHLNNLDIFLETDVTQDLNYKLNGMYQGPYNVAMKILDIVSTDDFTLLDIKSIYNNNQFLIGNEFCRIFYPENITKNNSCPLFVFTHGAGQNVEDYDIYYSTLASYGYVCLGIYHIPPIETLCATSIAVKIINYIDYIKQNISTISDGLLINLIDFDKLNFSGHSKGGGLASEIADSFKYKNSSLSSIKNISLEYDSVKTKILFSPVEDAFTTKLGSTIRYTTVVNDLDISDIENIFDIKDIPTLLFISAQDTDVGIGSYANNMHMNGFSYSSNINLCESKTILVTGTDHGNFGSKTFGNNMTADQYNMVRFNTNINASKYISGPLPKETGRYEFGLSVNSLFRHFSYFKKEILSFLAAHNFNSTKIKKINYNNRIEYNNYDLFPEYFLYTTIKHSITDIDYYIDKFSGLTLSLAGSTGMTLTTGHTYDYLQDITSSSISAIIGGSTFTDYSLNRKIYNVGTLTNQYFTTVYPTSGNSLTHQLHTTTYKGVVFDTQNLNVFVGYTLTSPITLNENSYLVVNGGLISKHPYSAGVGVSYGYTERVYDGSAGNTADGNFNLTLFDISNNSSTLSSKLYNYGFKKNIQQITKTEFKVMEQVCIRTAVECNYFRAGDFYLKNNNLDISNISQILLSFGPSHGSTLCHIALDSFFVMKEL